MQNPVDFCGRFQLLGENIQNPFLTLEMFDEPSEGQKCYVNICIKKQHQSNQSAKQRHCNTVNSRYLDFGYLE